VVPEFMSQHPDSLFRRETLAERDGSLIVAIQVQALPGQPMTVDAVNLHAVRAREAQ
jgi:hypothetical protein